jgi:NAD(P)-dependent dehydrogenase (short-subunit alcohol dehydrogenase family)
MSATLRVMITAAATGIGASIARAFADEGHRVHASDIDEEALSRLNDDYPDIVTTPVDVRDEDGIDTWFDDTVDTLDGLDVLINNAGIAGPTAAIEDMDCDGWRECLAVCLDAQFLTCRRAVPVMKDQRSGSIINISSTAGLYGLPFRTPYAAAKWGVIGLTKSLAIEVGRWNIRVNAICPGAVEGDRMDRVIAAESRTSGRSQAELRAEYTKGVSLNRFVRPQEIAALALFLASPKAAMISGQAIAVDGNSETYHTE